MYRSRSYKKEERREAKEAKKGNWFKQNSKGEVIYDSVLFVPATPKSELKTIIEDEAKACNLRVRVVEKPGRKLIDYIKSSDKTNEKPKCGDESCIMCETDTKGGRKCRKSDIVYEITCEECKKAKKRARYFGETHFNAYTRGKQHLEKYNSNNENTQEKSALRKHAKDVHEDKHVKFGMKIVKNFKNDPLARQVHEAIKIVESKENDDYPMNTKSEFNQALIVTTKHTRGIY